MKPKLCLLFVVAFGIAQYSYCQPGYGPSGLDFHRDRGSRKKQRVFVAAGYALMTMKAQYHFVCNPQNGRYIDTAFTYKKTSSSGYTIQYGGSNNLKKMRENTALALDGVLSATFCKWKSNDITNADYGPLPTSATFNAFAETFSIVYRHGAEVAPHKKQRFMYAAGLGIAPEYVYGYFNNSGAFSGFRLRPLVITAECGIFAGIGMKLRASYDPVPVVFKNFDSNWNTAGALTANVNGTSGVVVSLAFMPYSNRWPE